MRQYVMTFTKDRGSYVSVETQLNNYLSNTNDRLVAIQYRPMLYSDDYPKLLAVFERMEDDREAKE